MLEVLGQDYIKTAKGRLPPSRADPRLKRASVSVIGEFRRAADRLVLTGNVFPTSPGLDGAQST
jgi:hypothetical protein